MPRKPLKSHYQESFYPDIPKGGVMSLAEGIKHNLAGLLVFAGVLLTPHTLQNAHVHSPEIVYIHGENVEVMPLSALEYTKQIL